jgi:hypothetical protein
MRFFILLRICCLCAALIALPTSMIAQGSDEPLNIQTSTAGISSPRHRVGIGVSYAGGDRVMPDAMISLLYGYRLSTLVELQGNLHLFYNRSPVASMQQLDIGVSISPFDGVLRNFSITPGIGVCRLQSAFGGDGSLDPLLLLRVEQRLLSHESLGAFFGKQWFLSIVAASQTAYRTDLVRLPEKVYRWGGISFSSLGLRLSLEL